MKKGVIMAGFLASLLSIFGAGCTSEEAYEPAESYELAEVYISLRQQIIEIDPLKLGLEPEGGSEVWAVLMETGHKDAVATLVAIADGTVSLYFSNGGGYIGNGEIESVRKVSDEYIKLAEQYVNKAQLTDIYPLPEKNNTRFYFLTYEGIYTIEDKEDDFGNNKLPLSPLFHKAHEVITQIRIADQEKKVVK